MTTDQLALAYQAARKRPQKDWDTLARQIWEAIEELVWQETLNHPAADQYLCELEDEAIAEYMAGETEEGGFDGL